MDALMAGATIDWAEKIRTEDTPHAVVEEARGLAVRHEADVRHHAPDAPRRKESAIRLDPPSDRQDIAAAHYSLLPALGEPGCPISVLQPSGTAPKSYGITVGSEPAWHQCRKE
jgi:hypothetical protein